MTQNEIKRREQKLKKLKAAHNAQNGVGNDIENGEHSPNEDELDTNIHKLLKKLELKALALNIFIYYILLIISYINNYYKIK